MFRRNSIRIAIKDDFYFQYVLNEDNGLQVFRHGNRTSDRFSYPKDPYLNNTYYPYGFGQLTNAGKQQVYMIGNDLRMRYHNFLGDVYTPDLLDAVSTQYDRTKMSLALVLAALFPPKDTPLEWNKNLNWSPISYASVSFKHDNHLFSFPFCFCPKYINGYRDYLNSKDGLALENKYADLFQYLTKHSGLNVTRLVHVLGLYITLETQENWGLSLPTWTKQVYPQRMLEACEQFHYTSSVMPKFKQLSGGFLLQKIIKDTQALINKTSTLADRKLYIYALHDTNVAQLLTALEVFVPHQPPYGAYILIEVHLIDSVYGNKIFYQDYTQDEPKPLKIPGCNFFCPFDEFVRLLNKNLPQADDPCGDKIYHIENLCNIE